MTRQLHIAKADQRFLRSLDLSQLESWLDDHQRAVIKIEAWCLTIMSPDFDDVDFESHSGPVFIDGSIEDFRKTRDGDDWMCCWSIS